MNRITKHTTITHQYDDAPPVTLTTVATYLPEQDVESFKRRVTIEPGEHLKLHNIGSWIEPKDVEMVVVHNVAKRRTSIATPEEQAEAELAVLDISFDGKTSNMDVRVVYGDSLNCRVVKPKKFTMINNSPTRVQLDLIVIPK